MKLPLDQGLPRSTVWYLTKQKISCIHVTDVGLADASDAVILDYAREEGRVIVTLDADFHTLLALTGATFPSVVRVRIEGLRA